MSKLIRRKKFQFGGSPLKPFIPLLQKLTNKFVNNPIQSFGLYNPEEHRANDTEILVSGQDKNGYPTIGTTWKYALNETQPPLLGTPVSKFNFGKLSSKNKFDLLYDSTKYRNTDGSINISLLKSDIDKGIQDAIDFLQSNTYINTAIKNNKIAQKLGFKTFPWYEQSAQRVQQRPPIKLAYGDSQIGGSVGLNFDPVKDDFMINFAHDPFYTAFHESLHRGSYGGMPLLRETHDINKSILKFQQFKADKLLKPYEQLVNEGLDQYEYVQHPEELAVNLMEIGKRLGLKIGDKFPGEKEFFNIINQAKQDIPGKSSIFDFLNMSKPKRIWDAMTGQYFSYNNNNINSNYDDRAKSYLT